MGIPKPIIIVCCAYLIHASHSSDDSYQIPVEGYKSELQNLGQHVDVHETPVKIIKITKTVAVKVPVPYPVKVIQKVPYPVHVNRPYPVPVPQIVKIPVPVHPDHGPQPLQAHEALDVDHYGNNLHRNGNNYLVQENGQHGGEESHAPAQGQHAYEGDDSNSYRYEDSIGNNFDASYPYGHDEGLGSAESKNYDQAIQGYLANSANQVHGNHFGRH